MSVSLSTVEVIIVRKFVGDIGSSRVDVVNTFVFLRVLSVVIIIYSIRYTSVKHQKFNTRHPFSMPAFFYYILAITKSMLHSRAQARTKIGNFMDFQTLLK